MSNQSLVGGNRMLMLTHTDSEEIPEGFATLCIDNNGWVGTNNGHPHAGQPALFPIAQAEAIVIAWTCALGKMPCNVYHPEVFTKEARKWLRWPETKG